MRALALRASVVPMVVLLSLAGCAGPASPSPRTIGLHLENRISNVVLFAIGTHWVGTPPPVSTYAQIVPACGGHLDTYVRAATADAPSLLSLNVDSTGELDHQLALASNSLDDVPGTVLQRALIMWSHGDIDVESWLTITPDEVIQSTVAPTAPSDGACSPWSSSPEPS